LGRLGVAVTTCTDEQDSTIQMINLSSRSTLFVKEEDIITSLLLAVQETLKGL
jgi:vacuolar-type H+-ATPase subunit E/Vma4